MGDSMSHFTSLAGSKSRPVARYAAVMALCLWCCTGPSAGAQSSSSAVSKTVPGFSSPKPAPASTPQSPEPSPSAPTTSEPSAIALPDVTSRAEDLKRLLRSVSDQLPTRQQFDDMQATLKARDEELKAKQREVEELRASTPTSLELREQQSYWRSIEAETAGTRKQLLDWANAAQAAIKQLQAQEPQWSKTLAENKSSPDLGPVLDLIAQSVAGIQTLKSQTENQLRSIVNLQVQAGNQDQLALDVLDELNQANSRVNHSLLYRDSPPLWQLAGQPAQGEVIDVYQTPSARFLSMRAFAREHNGGLAVFVVLLFVSLFGAYRLRATTRHIQPENDEQAKVLRIVRQWFALGLLPPLFFCFVLAPSAPVPLIGLSVLAAFIPILILLPPLIEKPLRVLLYCVAGVYFLNALISWAAFSPAHKRETQVLFNLVVFVIFAVLARPSHLERSSISTTSERAAVFGIRLAIAILGVMVLANVFGYVRLAQYLGLVVIYSTFIAISVTTAVRVLTPLLVAGLSTSAAEQFAAVRLQRDGILRWTPRLLEWGGILLWVMTTLGLLGIRDWVSQQIDTLLDFHIAGGGASVTLGGVLGFFFILLFGYALSSAVRFLLREELLKRLRLSRGLPELIASTLHYLFLLLVFFYAVNKGGIELNKFTLLTGALGVGVGFGLQNIVNNFVSGLILQFERPIHIGDVLDMDGTTGKVTRIGIRSSTILTLQGAEVILPNANFISGKVINWTLSEAKRRVEIPVGVAYGSDATLVSRLLLQAATNHESVLTLPPPAVYFKEFGESSLNFELQFWVMQESNTVKVKSEVALVLMQSLGEAGIEIPFPQRDLRLRSVDPAAGALLTGNESSNGREAESTVANKLGPAGK